MRAVLVFQVPQDYSRLSPGESHPLHALSPGIRSRSRGGPPGRSAVAVPLPAAANSRTQPPTSRTSPARPRRLRHTSHAVTASSSQASQPPQPAMATASEGVVLPVGGVIKEPHPCCTGSLACPPLDGGAFGGVTSLEASFAETHLSLWLCRCRRGQGWPLPVVRQGGWCRRLARRGLPSPHGGGQNYARSQGSSLGCRFLAACSGPRRLALLGNCQCGVGLRRRTALAATTSWED